MQRLLSVAILALSAVFSAEPTVAQVYKYNSEHRKAHILDLCPHLRIVHFDWQNSLQERTYSSRHEFSYGWANVGTQPIIAFEIVTLKYDPFDQPMIGSRFVIIGNHSADFSPLDVGKTATDGTTSYGHTRVLTAIAYVRSVRLADGTVWRVDENRLRSELKKVAPGMKDYGPLVPEKKENDRREKSDQS